MDCGETSVPVRGTCVEGVCECRAPWAGESCAKDLCAEFKQCGSCRMANEAPPAEHQLGCMWSSGECFGVGVPVNNNFACSEDKLRFTATLSLIGAVGLLVAVVSWWIKKRRSGVPGASQGTYAPVAQPGGAAPEESWDDDWEEEEEHGQQHGAAARAARSASSVSHGNGSASGNGSFGHDEEDDLALAIELSKMEAATAPSGPAHGRGASGGGAPVRRDAPTRPQRQPKPKQAEQQPEQPQQQDFFSDLGIEARPTFNSAGEGATRAPPTAQPFRVASLSAAAAAPPSQGSAWDDDDDLNLDDV